MYNEYEIRPLPLSVPAWRSRVEAFLQANGLRLEEVDYYAGVFKHGSDEEILAGGGLKGDVIKCVAVGKDLREEGFSSRLVSHLLSEASTAGFSSVKVFTKAENEHVFADMGFKTIACGGKATLMERGDGLEKLKAKYERLKAEAGSGATGCIVMNANPFTRGHQYLIEQAARRCTRLFVIAVGEDCSQFSYAERVEMIRAGAAHLENVSVIEGSSYVVSATTFPTYFLKSRDEGTDTQICLDLDLFARHIAPSLGVEVRFVGSEPFDALTRRYNELMAQELPKRGIRVEEVERLEDISASLVRRRLAEGDFSGAASLVPRSTYPYLLGWLATSALERELDLTPKPGLVDRYDNGAHRDMDYNTMKRSISALRPFFMQMAVLAADGLEIPRLQEMGRNAEKAMLQATGNVNTHRGALFALGLSVAVASFLLHSDRRLSAEELRKEISATAKRFPLAEGTHGSVVRTRHGAGGALAAAQEAWPLLFADWLPFYREHKDDAYGLHKTLLRIMAALDDTNILYRGGAEAAGRVKEEAKRLLADFSEYGLKRLNASLVTTNISPGGSADMLALVLFFDAIC